ncbi:MAG: EAL domain-containing protein [Burkholderiales bacterium]|nr:EAL domain-containing protein [Burkholderiales bacterium]
MADPDDAIAAPLPALDPARSWSYERHCTAIVESSSDAIIGQSLDGAVLSWNPAAERLFGYSEGEMRGQPVDRMVPVDRMAEERQLLERVARGERVATFETVRRSKSGRLVNVSVTASPILGARGEPIGSSKIVRDITERFRVQRAIWMQDNFDTLTGLPKRGHFGATLDEIVERSRSSGQRLAVLHIDLDRFKQINGTLGRGRGDQLIAAAAARIRNALRPADSAARLGGDEFGVALTPLPSDDEIDEVGRRVLEALAEPFKIDAEDVFISCSIGVAKYPDDGASADELIRLAEMAMNDVKRAGGNGILHVTPNMAELAQRRMKLTADLRRAVELGQLFLVYQPIVDLRTAIVRKCEALLRWRHPEYGIVGPVQFIPLAEEAGLITGIGDWVFRTATEQNKIWRRRFGDDFQVSINMSPLQLLDSVTFAADWIADLSRRGGDAANTVIEITESMMVNPSTTTASQLRALRLAGFQIAIDDFGTGYSCLSNLNRLELNYLKIDQSFVRNLSNGGKDLALCKAIVAMAKALGLSVVAEGVETFEAHRLLQEIGCDYAQGYLYGRPLEVPNLESSWSDSWNTPDWRRDMLPDLAGLAPTAGGASVPSISTRVEPVDAPSQAVTNR